MMRSWLRVATAVTALALSAALAGCESAAASRDRQTLVALEPGDATTINPFFLNNQPASLYASLTLDPLAEIGPHLSFLPGLATHWSVSKDQLHWQVDLRKNAPWSDGVPFDSRDVVFTFRSVVDPKVASPYAGQFDFLKDVVAEGPYRVRFDMKRPYAAFVAIVLNGQFIAPAHAFAGIPPERIRTAPFGEHPIGNGPFQLVSWDHDVLVNFRANPTYWRGAPKIPRLAIRIILNADQYAEALDEGTGDLAEITSPTAYRKIVLDPRDFQFVHVPDLYERWILINLRVPGLDDIAVRHAMNYGYDRLDLTRGIFHGDERPDDTVTPWALTYWHDKRVAGYPYEPAKARSILDAAGWLPGPDGIRRRGNVRLHFVVSLPNGSASAAAPIIAFKADMEKIGIAIDLQVIDYPTFINKTSDFEYQMGYSGWGGSVDPDQYTFLHSSQMPPVGNDDTGYKNLEVDRLLLAGQSAATPERRRAIYDKMQQITTADAPVVFGYDDYYRAVLSSRVDIRGDREPDTNFWWNVYDWRLRS